MRTLLVLALFFAFDPCFAAEESAVPPKAASGPLDPAALPDDSPPFVGLITGNRVNVRTGPGLSFETVTQLSKGAHLHVVGRKGPWYSIPLPPSAPVYVAKGFISVQGNAGTIQGKRVHVRSGPGQAFFSFGQLHEPDAVTVRGAAGDWIEIEPPDFCRGWVKIGRAHV